VSYGADVLTQAAQLVQQLRCDGETTVGWGTEGEVDCSEETGHWEAGQRLGVEPLLLVEEAHPAQVVVY
jgi:hypothetical protein